MTNKFLRAAAIVLAAILMLASFAGCKKKQDDPQDLPVYTSDPFALQTYPPEDETEPPAAQTEPAAETPTESATEAPTPTPKPTATPKPTPTPTPKPTECPVREDGQYTSKEDVALYIHLFGHLPSNFITKKEATALGWTGGSLEPYAPGSSIGGDHFGNYEGLLPKKKGRSYYECDIDTKGKSSRGAKRIVFSNDGLIYYSGDHYEHFELLYGGD